MLQIATNGCRKGNINHHHYLIVRNAFLFKELRGLKVYVYTLVTSDIDLQDLYQYCKAISYSRWFSSFLRKAPSSLTIFNGSVCPTPNRMKSAHFQRNGLTKTRNTNQYSNSVYVKKSNAPGGAPCFIQRVKFIQVFIRPSVGCVSGSVRNMSKNRV